MSVELFDKRELFVRQLQLNRVNLDQVAAVVARELGLKEHEVLVVDARADLLTLDVLNPRIDFARIAGRERALLKALAQIPGVGVTSETHVHSEGVLGLLNVEGADDGKLCEATSGLARAVQTQIARRALVFPTGSEIAAGQVTDTNTPFLVETLGREGFTVEVGATIPDDLHAAIGVLADAASRGFGLVVTTGGTGAESKDCIVEAIQALDPSAAATYVVRYTRGQGRHHKDGVRIAVGSLELTTYVALTGPHREVRLVAPVLTRGLTDQWENAKLSGELARVLTANMAHRGETHLAGERPG